MSVIKKIASVGVALTIGIAVSACDIDQTQAGELPDVDVDVDAGQLPRYDVDVADVDVGTTQDTIVIERPTVKVKMPDDRRGNDTVGN